MSPSFREAGDQRYLRQGEEVGRVEEDVSYDNDGSAENRAEESPKGVEARVAWRASSNQTGVLGSDEGRRTVGMRPSGARREGARGVAPAAELANAQVRAARTTVGVGGPTPASAFFTVSSVGLLGNATVSRA